jgi:hypothetical protein
MVEKMERSQILLEPAQRKALEEMARKKGISISGVVREIICEHVAGREQDRSLRLARWEKERQFIESLNEPGQATGRRTWTREDIYQD